MKRAHEEQESPCPAFPLEIITKHVSTHLLPLDLNSVRNVNKFLWMELAPVSLSAILYDHYFTMIRVHSMPMFRAILMRHQKRSREHVQFFQGGPRHDCKFPNFYAKQSMASTFGLGSDEFPHNDNYVIGYELDRVLTAFEAAVNTKAKAKAKANPPLTNWPDGLKQAIFHSSSLVEVVALLLAVLYQGFRLQYTGFVVLPCVLIQMVKNQHHYNSSSSKLEIMRSIRTKFLEYVTWVNGFWTEENQNQTDYPSVMRFVDLLLFCENLQPIPKYSADPSLRDNSYNLHSIDNRYQEQLVRALCELLVHNFIPRYVKSYSFPDGLVEIAKDIIKRQVDLNFFKVSLHFELKCTITQ